MYKITSGLAQTRSISSVSSLFVQDRGVMARHVLFLDFILDVVLAVIALQLVACHHSPCLPVLMGTVDECGLETDKAQWEIDCPIPSQLEHKIMVIALATWVRVIR